MSSETEDMGNSHSPFPDSREVLTTHGPIIGRRLIHEGEKLVDAFQGIPYARPPVGELRFEKPVPPDSWTEVKDCKAFGPRSMQKTHALERRKLPPVSEDCLTLNVFSPVWQPPDEKGFAVMVFIHGGAFLSDSCCKYGDQTLCEHVCKKDIVMVTLQYRLGYLGMLSTGDVLCKGNQNLWDQTLALAWVKDNISRFGGNPENVTIMGQSAGGASVDLLSLSPHSRDLFHKVIPMAGNASCDFAVNYNVVETCRIAAESFGVTCCQDSQKFLDMLRKLPAETFACAMEQSGPDNPIKLGPRIEGDFLPKHPDELRKESPPKPRLYGLCRSEGLIFANNKKATREAHIDEVAARLFPEKDFPNDFGRLRREYATKVRELIVDGEKETIAYAACQASGDSFLGIGTQKAVLESLETGYEPVYLYRFDYFNPKAYGGMASFVTPYKDASHCGDISYFVCEAIGLPFTFDELDMKMVDLWTTLFTNFAKYGNPNGEATSPLGAEEWLPATISDPQRHLQISLKPKMSSNFFEGRPMWYIQQMRQFGKKENSD